MQTTACYQSTEAVAECLDGQKYPGLNLVNFFTKEIEHPITMFDTDHPIQLKS